MTRPAEVWEKIKPFVMSDLGALLDEFGTVGAQLTGDEKDIVLEDVSAEALFFYDYSEAGLLAAVDASNDGDKIYVPAGTLNITQSLDFGSNDVTLVGAGPGATYIYAAGAYQYGLEGTGFLSLQNIYIQHTSSYTGAGATYTVRSNKAIRIENCEIGMYPSSTSNDAGALLCTGVDPITYINDSKFLTFRADTGTGYGISYTTGDDEEDQNIATFDNVVAIAVNTQDTAGSGDSYGADFTFSDSNAPNTNALTVTGLTAIAHSQNTTSDTYGIKVNDTGSGDFRISFHGCAGYALGGQNAYGMHLTSTNSKVRFQDCFGYSRPTEGSGTSYGIGLLGGIHLLGSTGEYDTSVAQTGYGIYSDGSNTITHSTAIGRTNDLYINSGTTSVYAVQYDNRGGAGSIAHLGGDLAPGGAGAAGTLFTQTASVTVANTVTETTLVGSGVGSATLPANFFTVGRNVRIKMRGYNSTGPSAGTITFRVKLGSTTICATPSNTATNNLSNRGWGVEADLTCRTTGASGTVFGQGKSFRSTGAGTSNHWMMTSTAAATVDTTTTQALSVTVQWGTASASNTITATNFTIEVMN